MLFTNEIKHGGNFKKQFAASIKGAKTLTIASGYFGALLIDELKPAILAMSAKGKCKILFGMIFHGGVTAKQEKTLKDLDKALRATDPNNGVYVSRKEYHGKIYCIDDDIYLGSSNFSEHGFQSRWECTAKINSVATKKQAKDYLDFLFSHKTIAKLDEVALRSTSAPL